MLKRSQKDKSIFYAPMAADGGPTGGEGLKK